MLAAQDAIEKAADEGGCGEADEEEDEDEPGGAAAGFLGRLGDAEGVDEGGGERLEQTHGDSLDLMSERIWLESLRCGGHLMVECSVLEVCTARDYTE